MFQPEVLIKPEPTIPEATPTPNNANLSPPRPVAPAPRPPSLLILAPHHAGGRHPAPAHGAATPPHTGHGARPAARPHLHAAHRFGIPRTETENRGTGLPPPGINMFATEIFYKNFQG